MVVILVFHQPVNYLLHLMVLMMKTVMQGFLSMWIKMMDIPGQMKKEIIQEKQVIDMNILFLKVGNQRKQLSLGHLATPPLVSPQNDV